MNSNDCDYCVGTHLMRIYSNSSLSLCSGKDSYTVINVLLFVGPIEYPQ